MPAIFTCYYNSVLSTFRENPRVAKLNNGFLSMSLIKFFTSREIALFIWLLVVLFIGMFSQVLRSSIREVITAFFQWKLFRIWLSMVMYFTSWTIVMFYLNLW